MVYLDYAATAPLDQNVGKHLRAKFNWHNPNSVYGDAQAAKHDINIARQIIAAFIGAEPDEIIFTSGGSEANAMAIDGFLAANPQYKECHCTPIEHSSILLNPKCSSDIIVDKNGMVLTDSLPDDPAFCSVMMVNNEIGTIQPINKIAKIIHDRGGILFCDGVQALGKMMIDVKDLDVDMMSFSGHKIGALKGIGFLYVKRDIQLKPIIYGTQENGLRGGTYNQLGVVSLRCAIENIDWKKIPHIRMLRNYLFARLTEIDGVFMNGSIEDRCVSNVNVRFPKYSLTGEQVAIILDLMGFQVSAGSACHEGDKNPSHVLLAIGLSPDEALASIRISIGSQTTIEEVDAFVDAFKSTLELSKNNG